MLMNPKTECDTIAEGLNFPKKGEIINGKKVLAANCKLAQGTVFSYEIRFAATTKPNEVRKVLKEFYSTHSLPTTVPRVVKYHDYQIRSKNNNTIISGALHVVPTAHQNPGQALTTLQQFDEDYSKMEMEEPTKYFRKFDYSGFKGPGFRAKLFSFVSYMGENYGYCCDKYLYHRRASLIMPKIKITMAVKNAQMFYHTHPKKDEPSLSSPDDFLLYFDLSHEPRNIRNFYTVMDDRMDYFHITPKKGSKGKFLQLEEDKFLKEVDTQMDNLEEIWTGKIPAEESTKQDGLRYCENITRDLVKWMNKKYASYFTIKYQCHYKVRKNPPEPTSDDIHLGDEFLVKALNDIKSGEYAWPEFNSTEMPHENYAYWHQMYYVLHSNDYNLNIGMGWMPGDQRRLEYYLKLKIPESEMSYEDALNILNFAYDVSRSDSKIRDSGALQSRMKEITEFLGMSETLVEDLLMLEQLIHTEDPFGEVAKTLSGDYYPLVLLSNYSIQAVEIMKQVKSGKMDLQIAKLEVYANLKEKTSKELTPFFYEKNTRDGVRVNPPIRLGQVVMYAVFPTKAFDFSDIYTDALGEFGANLIDPKSPFETKTGGINLRVPTQYGLVSMTIFKSTGKAQIRYSSEDYMEAAMEAVNKVGMKLYQFGAEGIDPKDFEVKVESPAMNPAPQIIALCGPSGSGKSTTLRALLKHLPGSKTVPTVTTRDRRRSDKPGEKLFVKDSEFKEMLEAGDLVAATLQRNGHYYGRKRSDFTDATYIVMDVSLRGLNDVRVAFPNTFSVYLEPSESPEYIEKRLLRRGDISPQEARGRAQLIPSHIKSSYAMAFDLRVKTVQGKFDYAAKEVLEAVPKTNPPKSNPRHRREDKSPTNVFGGVKEMTKQRREAAAEKTFSEKKPDKPRYEMDSGWYYIPDYLAGNMISTHFLWRLGARKPAVDALGKKAKEIIKLAGGGSDSVIQSFFDDDNNREVLNDYFNYAVRYFKTNKLLIDRTKVKSDMVSGMRLYRTYSNPRMDDIEELKKHSTSLSNPSKLTLTQIAKSVHKDNHVGGGAFGEVFRIPGTTQLFKVNEKSDQPFYTKLEKHLKDGSPVSYQIKDAKLYKVDYHIPFEVGQPRYWIKKGEKGRDIVMNNIEGNVIKGYIPQQQFKEFKKRNAAQAGKINYYPKKNILKYYKYIEELANIPQSSVNNIAKQIKHLMSKGIVIDVNSGNLIYNPKTKTLHLIDWFWDARSGGKTVLSGPPFVQIVERVGLAEWSLDMLEYFNNHHEKFPEEFNLVKDLDKKNEDNMIEWLNKVSIAFKKADLSRGKRNIEGTNMGNVREGESYEDFFKRLVKEGDDARWTDAAFQDGADRFDYALANPSKLTVRIEESTNPEKKLMAVFTKPNGRTKTTHFGARGMSDYTQHKDPKRKKNYLARHGGMGENWNDPTTAGALSRWILWGKPSLRESFNDFKKKFKIEGVMAVTNTKMNPPYTTKFDFVPGKEYTFDELPDDHGGATSLREDALHHFRSKEGSSRGYGWPGRAEDATYRAVIIPVDELVERYGHLKGRLSLQKHIEKYGLDYPSIGNEGNNRRIAMAKLGRDMPHLEVVPSETLFNPNWRHGTQAEDDPFEEYF